MKMSRLISIALLGVALVATPVYAQRGGGGGRSGGGSSSSHSSGGSRGGGGFSGSSSRGSSYSSSPSRSSSSSSSYRSSSSSSSSRSSYSSSPSRSSSSSDRGYNSGYDGRSSSSYSSSPSRGMSATSSNRGSYDRTGSRTGSVPAQVRDRAATNGSRSGAMTTRGGEGARGGNPALRGEPNGGSRVGDGRPGGNPNVAPGNGGVHQGGAMPPSHRPMHPAPYFWHPHHHCMVHCHRLFWDPFPPRPYYWPGFWWYCDSYWYDYHVTDIRVVHEYVKETYSMDLISYAMSGDYMYALVNDPDGHTYIQIYDKSDKLLAEQQVSRKYIKMEVDAKNGGCWIMKKKDRDPLLFLYADGQLLIYEADK